MISNTILLDSSLPVVTVEKFDYDCLVKLADGMSYDFVVVNPKVYASMRGWGQFRMSTTHEIISAGVCGRINDIKIFVKAKLPQNRVVLTSGDFVAEKSLALEVANFGLQDSRRLSN